MASPTLGTYSFLSYLRIGLANTIAQPDGAPVQLRAGIDVGLALEGQPLSGSTLLTQPVTRPVQLYGPGDIVGIEARAILKTEPRDWITNFEPNYLPYIDFYEEDFPWRYTPARADDATHRLRPWITLVVLEEGEFAEGRNLQGKLLPYIEVAAAAASFPPASQLWAWAHVHVNADLAASADQISSTNMAAVLPKLDHALNSNADVAYARLLCPRKLKPNTAYHAFLVPTFETGRRAGLGLPVASDYATQPAWGEHPDQTEFPCYYRWFFRTGIEGDFESLVRVLAAKPADQRVGRRDLDVQAPGWNLPGLDANDTLGGILRLGGALRVPELAITDMEDYLKYEHWADAGYPQPIQRGIAAFLNLADDYQHPGPHPQPLPDPDGALDPDPLITPPLYGRWHAAVERLLTLQDGTGVPDHRNWIHELNLDPRFRVAAGFGTRVIQQHQEQYMHAAWQQVGDVVAVNRLIRFAQVTHEALLQWHTHQLAPLLAAQPDQLMWLTAPVQKRVLVQGGAGTGAPAARVTVAYQLRASLVPPVAVSAQMRRMARPRGRMVKQLAFAAHNLHAHDLVRRLNAGEVRPAPVKPVPAALHSEAALADAVQPPPRPRWLARLLARFPWLPRATLLLALAMLVLALVLPIALLAVAVLGYLYGAMRRIARLLAAPQVFADGAQTPEMVAQAPASPDFVLTTPTDSFHPGPGATDSAEGVRFKQAVTDLYAVDVAARPAGQVPPRQALDLAAVTAGIAQALHPAQSLARLVLDRIVLPGHLQPAFDPAQPDPVMHYPRFDLPMYQPLVDLDAEWFLPNLNRIPPDSITLLEPNQKFIEAYMVGLNHEMARELLWREYPTDQRGSYFRQFWDVSGYLADASEDPATLAERLRDIPEIHTWTRQSALGEHDNREVNGNQETEVVLVIRGELLKRYPTAVIYAHKARWQMQKNPDGTDSNEIDNTVERDLALIPAGREDRPPRDIVKTPLYSAKIAPDIYFFGFDLTAEAAMGSDGTHPGDVDKPGWFFVIKERPGEPRFGFDIGGPNAELNTWSDLAWEDVAPGLPEGGFLDIGAGMHVPPPLTPPSDPAQAEYDEELAQHGEDKQVAWNSAADAADVAYVAFQVPVMVAVHASEMLTIKP